MSTKTTMSIVCGTDLSDRSNQAALAAGAIAKLLGAPLKLVHVIDELGAELTAESEQQAAYDPLRKRVHDHAAELGQKLAIEVEPVVVPGHMADRLIEVAQIASAGLLVVSSLGAEKQQRWLLGSAAERVAQSSTLPVLVVRDGTRFEAWARGDRPLRVMVGVELASTSRAALRWAAGLRALAPCDILVTQVVWPIGEHVRLGVSGPTPLDHLRPEIEAPLIRDLRAWVGQLSGAGETTVKVSHGWGPVDVSLTQLAIEADADLLVVGTHQRTGVARLWEGSVSRGVLHNAPCSVACVPRAAMAREEVSISTFRRVLIPTDLSTFANRAIPVGYGLVAPGGIVHLLHVITRKPGETPDPSEPLRALIPPGAAARGIKTELEIVHDEDAANGIWHAAGRLGVDAICMATHGRTGASQLVLGSQAQQVLQRVRQPLVLVPPEREK